MITKALLNSASVATIRCVDHWRKFSDLIESVEEEGKQNEKPTGKYLEQPDD